MSIGFFGNPNFPQFGTGFQLAGAIDYSQALKNVPMFNSNFQTETGDSSGLPPETVPTIAKKDDPAGLMTKTEMGELLGYLKDRDAAQPARNREQMQDFLAFEKERMRAGTPYKLMQQIPDRITRSFEATARNTALQGALINAGATDVAAIMGGTKIPLAGIPSPGNYQQRTSYFGG
jgi:hypothetical protein